MNTTNPYTQINSSPWDEKNLDEGPIPLNVLIFGDEEAQNTLYWVLWYSPSGIFVNWEDYAVWQIERGDEAFIANFGIDIRVRGALTWDSNDSEPYFANESLKWDLLREFYSENRHYIGSVYNGYLIDAIIGITAQSTIDSTPGATFYISGISTDTVLLRWEVYWADDNLVQHEISHLFYAPDHDYGWCVMSREYRWVGYITEDGFTWIVMSDVRTCKLAYDYCNSCYNTVNSKKYRYMHFALHLVIDEQDVYGYHEIAWAIKWELAKIKIGVEIEYRTAQQIADTVWSYFWNIPWNESITQGWDMTWYEFSGSFDDLGSHYLASATPPNGYNIMGWNNKKADDWYIKAQTTLDPVARKNYMDQWQTVYMHDPPAAVLYYPTQPICSRSLAFNLHNRYLSNRYVRLAIAQAIPYPKIINEILPSYGVNA